MTGELPNCHDCGVPPGTNHVLGCDVERCPSCGHQRISCGCDCDRTAAPLPWTGEWPGAADARRLGLWCKEGPKLFPWSLVGTWVPCDATDEGARPDLNRLATVARWNPTARQWEARA